MNMICFDLWPPLFVAVVHNRQCSQSSAKVKESELVLLFTAQLVQALLDIVQCEVPLSKQKSRER